MSLRKSKGVKMVLSISIILPTYNERENILILIPAIDAVFRQNKTYVLKEIILVDDYSPDNTAEACLELQEKYPYVRLHQKKKEGIGAALQEGYKLAQSDVIVSMDSDLSFSPEDVLRLLRKIDEGYDLVLGCRHSVKGGYEKSAFMTKIKGSLSSLGNKIIPYIINIDLHDFSANFRAIRKDIWKSLEVKEMTNLFLLEMIIKAQRSGYRITEVPVVFKERKFGKSKLNLFVESLRFMYKLVFCYRKL